MDFTQILALYGAVIATFTGIWQLYTYVVDKGKLKVNCYVASIVSFLTEEEKKRRYFYFTITNIGKKPIMVRDLGGSYKEKNQHFCISVPGLPRELLPGHFINFPIEVFSEFNKDVKKIWVSDSLGTYYNLSNRELNQLKKDAQKYLKNSNNAD